MFDYACNGRLIFYNNRLWSKDVEVSCVALVSYKVRIIYEINEPSAKYVNVEVRSFDSIPDERLSPKRRILKFFSKFTYFALPSLIS